MRADASTTAWVRAGSDASRLGWRRSGKTATARAHLQEALVGFRAMPAPFEAATTRLDLATLAGGGDPAAAAYLTEARLAFAALGLDAHVERVDALAMRLEKTVDG
jgi:hypothetical protein